MATETEQICPICRDAPCDVAFAMPCRHQFCLLCIRRWLDLKGECPLCRGPVEIIQIPIQGPNYCVGCLHPEESPDASSQAGTAPSSPHDPVVAPPPSPEQTLSPDEQGTARPVAQPVGGIPPEVWADLIQAKRHLLNPLLPWLHQELWSICGPRWWQACRAEANVLHTLCDSGPVAEALVQVLQPDLGEDAAPLVHSVINIIEDQCSQQAWRQLFSRAVQEEEDDSSVAGSRSNNSRPTSSSSTSSSPTCSWFMTSILDLPSSTSPEIFNREEEDAGTSEATLCGDPGCPLCAPVLAEQEHPEEEPGQAEVAGPSAQGCNRSPSTPGCSRDGSTGKSWCPPKRKAPSPQNSPQPCKRPHRQQH
ncbi:uncharacterized protein LOC113490270 [Athene cunicularia]|uniref:uncharacterized protein LOC113490270 n=1 Tax=Athene cunicularia TaxID=194338 RepID=UPI000EF66A09|nr:uncharacterized protein LOC113490270 [Athene cunicularia]XP_026722405.1 uncharacterized protein LOC113490270 [Athene cunicularia]